MVVPNNLTIQSSHTCVCGNNFPPVWDSVLMWETHTNCTFMHLFALFFTAAGNCGSKYTVMKWTTHSGCHPIQVNVSLEVFMKAHIRLCKVSKARKAKYWEFAAIMRPDNIVKWVQPIKSCLRALIISIIKGWLSASLTEWTGFSVDSLQRDDKISLNSCVEDVLKEVSDQSSLSGPELPWPSENSHS